MQSWTVHKQGLLDNHQTLTKPNFKSHNKIDSLFSKHLILVVSQELCVDLAGKKSNCRIRLLDCSVNTFGIFIIY